MRWRELKCSQCELFLFENPMMHLINLIELESKQKAADFKKAHFWLMFLVYFTFF